MPPPACCEFFDYEGLAIKEPWRVISETGTIGQNAGLTPVVKTNFGEAATLRPQLLKLVLADIPLVG